MSVLNRMQAIYLQGAIVYLVLISITIGRRSIKDRVARILSVYLGVALFIDLGLLLILDDHFQILPSFFFANLSLYGIFLRSVFLLHLSKLFFRRMATWYQWALGIIILSIVLGLDYTWSSAPYILNISPLLVLDGRAVMKTVIAIGWGIYMVGTIRGTFQAYRTETNLVTKTRIRYWVFGLILTLAGDILIFFNPVYPGIYLKLSGAVVIALIMLTTRLPDLRGVFRRVSVVLATAVIELIVYTLGFYVLQEIFIGIPGYTPIFISLCLGLILLLVFNPILRFMKNLMNRLFWGIEKDYGQVLRTYSKRISSVLDLKILSKVILELISERIDVEKGILFTVDIETSGDSERFYRLIEADSKKGDTRPPGLISLDSQIAKTFIEERKSVSITEIDIAPEFQMIMRDERIWLKHHKLDIFIPIFGMDEWIGLLALGPKKSGNSYTKSEINFLETLADQTAVALQNARLVDSLMRVNNEFRKAYTAMEEAHTKLERLERSKSDFISISSHELRTPLTVLSGYSQMLLEDTALMENDYYLKVIKGINEGTERIHEIVNSMLDVARIDMRALELQAVPINIGNLIYEITAGFLEVMTNRRQEINIDNLDALPQVNGDLEALNKVFYHLLSNAIKFTPDGGKISINGSIIKPVEEGENNDIIEIVVSDTGIGIDPRYIDLIFTKFYQTGEVAMHSTSRTKFKGGGPGLGLVIVRGIVEAHGGKVWAESPGFDEEKNPGSDFHVTLPVHNQFS